MEFVFAVLVVSILVLIGMGVFDLINGTYRDDTLLKD